MKHLIKKGLSMIIAAILAVGFIALPTGEAATLSWWTLNINKNVTFYSTSVVQGGSGQDYIEIPPIAVSSGNGSTPVISMQIREWDSGGFTNIKGFSVYPKSYTQRIAFASGIYADGSDGKAEIYLHYTSNFTPTKSVIAKLVD